MAERNASAGAGVQRPPKVKPNYFVAIQITSLEIHEALGEVQRAILKGNPRLKPVVMPLATAHITLMVMKLDDERDILRASEALNTCDANLRHSFEARDPVLEISGLGKFGNQVVFAKIKPDQSLEDLKSIAENVVKCMRGNSISTTDGPGKVLKPHITLVKMSEAEPWFKKKVAKYIDPSLYEDFLETNFGSERITKLQLCSMGTPKDTSGYYHIVHEAEFGKK